MRDSIVETNTSRRSTRSSSFSMFPAVAVSSSVGFACASASGRRSHTRIGPSPVSSQFALSPRDSQNAEMNSTLGEAPCM